MMYQIYIAVWATEIFHNRMTGKMNKKFVKRFNNFILELEYYFFFDNMYNLSKTLNSFPTQSRWTKKSCFPSIVGGFSLQFFFEKSTNHSKEALVKFEN